MNWRRSFQCHVFCGRVSWRKKLKTIESLFTCSLWKKIRRKIKKTTTHKLESTVEPLLSGGLVSESSSGPPLSVTQRRERALRDRERGARTGLPSKQASYLLPKPVFTDTCSFYRLLLLYYSVFGNFANYFMHSSRHFPSIALFLGFSTLL